MPTHPIPGAALLLTLAMAGLAGCSSDSGPSAATSAPPTATSSASPSASAAGSDSPSQPAAGTAATSVPGATPVATADLVALISDRTYSGVFEGKSYKEYYGADGVIRGTQAGEPYVGTWELQGDQLCFSYPEDASQPAESDCYTAAVDGDTVYWFGDGEPSKTTYVTGNPDNL